MTNTHLRRFMLESCLNATQCTDEFRYEWHSTAIMHNIQFFSINIHMVLIVHLHSTFLAACEH